MLNNALTRHIVVNKVSGYLNGEERNFRKLLALGKRLDFKAYSVRTAIENIQNSLEENPAFLELFLRFGRNLNPVYRKQVFKNLVYNQYVIGAGKRRARSKQGDHVPTFIVVSPTMKCNLKCTGCYSGLYDKGEELSEAELDRIFREAKALGIYFVVISGGEPFLLKESLFRLFKKHHDMFFMMYTNGTLIDREAARKLARLGNVAPAISVEGYEAETDARRGKGVFKRIMDTMTILREEKVLFGFSATETRHNVYTLTDDAFPKFFSDKGALFGWYFMFMPVGRDPDLSLVMTPEQRVYAGNRVAEMRRKLPIFLADFWNDGPQAGGCLAGGRHYLHILNTGNVEPCVFAHFSSDNIRQKSLLEVANSPFFRSIRERFPYNENGNLKRPCMIIDNPQVLRDLVDEHIIPAGHTNSDAIIHDPDVVRWVDAYADAFKQLTDPAWEAIINDPTSRWYRYGRDYKELFSACETEKKKEQDAPCEVCTTCVR